jgi:hypothetical protein
VEIYANGSRILQLRRVVPYTLDAEAIVQAAIAFGQKDDITVVVIEREGAPVAVSLDSAVAV